MKYLDIKGMITARIGFGVPIFGSLIPADEGARRLDVYFEQGGNLVDTARVYVDFIPGMEKSASEKFLGRYIRDRGIRSETRISTKGGHPDPSFGPDWMKFSRFRPECIQGDLDRSLDNLDTDYIDFYWLHRDEAEVPVDEIMDVLHENQQAGKIRCYGASNWTTQRIAEANAYAAKKGYDGFFGSQIQYSYLNTHAMPDKTIVFMDEKRDTEFYRRWQAPLFCFTSMANGYMSKYLNGVDVTGHPFEDVFRTAYMFDDNYARARRAQKVAEKLGVGVETVGLAYLLNRPFPTVTLMQSDTRERICAVLAAAVLELSPEQLDYLAQD